MLNITLKDGAVREVAEGTSIADFVKSVSNSLAKKVLAAKLDGKTVDLATPLEKDAKVEFLTFEDADGRWALRHTGSHILAQALKRLYKNENVKLAIGPAIDNGFYYDIDMDRQLSDSDLADIEKEMKKIVKENLPLVRKEVSRDEALKLFEGLGESYKVELINDLPQDALITLYTQGEFTDLCAGPHVASTGKVKALKLMSIAGAYWRGDEHNKMLQRIYGTAFEKQADLDAYLPMLEEARPPQARQAARPLQPPRGRPGLPVLPSERHDHPQRTHQLLARSPSPLRLSGNQDPDDPEPQALGDVWPLGALQGQHVLHED